VLRDSYLLVLVDGVSFLCHISNSSSLFLFKCILFPCVLTALCCSATDRAVEPLKSELVELEQLIKDQQDKICAVRCNILKNEEKIQKMVTGINFFSRAWREKRLRRTNRTKQTHWRRRDERCLVQNSGKTFLNSFSSWSGMGSNTALWGVLSEKEMDPQHIRPHQVGDTRSDSTLISAVTDRRVHELIEKYLPALHVNFTPFL